jgi:hypothetical protein
MKTKTLKDKNGNPIQIEQSQVRGLKEALANAGGGASGNYVPVKTSYNVPDNTFNLSGNQEVGFNVEANLGDISNKVLYWDWQREQAIYDPQLGGAIQEIVIDLTNGTFTYGNKNFTLYIYLNVARGGEWDPNITSDTGFTINLPAMWTWQIDGVLNNIGATEIALEGSVDHTCNPNGDGNYLWFIMPNITDFSGNITFRIDVDNEGFATFTILQDYVY